jgi:hypothetical protein
MWRLSPLFYWARQPSYSIKTCRHSKERKRKKREIANRATFKLAAGASSWLYNQGLIRGGTVSFLSFYLISQLLILFFFFSWIYSSFYFFKKIAARLQRRFTDQGGVSYPSSLLLEMPQLFFSSIQRSSSIIYTRRCRRLLLLLSAFTGDLWFTTAIRFFSFLRQLFLTRIFSAHKYKI